MKNLIYSITTIGMLLFSQTGNAQINTVNKAEQDWWAHDTIYWTNTENIVTNRNIFSYNSEGKQIESLFQNQQNNTWVNNMKSINTYDDNNSQTITEYWQNNTWVKRYRQTNTYNSNNNMLTMLTETWVNDIWVNISKYAYTYDDNSNVKTMIMGSWQNDTWINTYKYTYTYDGNNNTLTNLLEIQKNNIWVNSSKSTYTYDNNNSQLTELSEVWQDDIWVKNNEFRNAYTYDNNNNVLTKLTETYQNDTLVNYYKYVYVYDGDNNCNMAEFWSWDENSWKAASGFITFYYNNMQSSTMIGSTHKILVSYKKTSNSNPSGIEDIELSRIAVFPNPTTGRLQIENKGQNIQQISIFDLFGTKLLNTKHTTIDLFHLPSGIYFIQITTEKDTTIKKIVKY